MSMKALLGLALIALGATSLAWPDLNYTKQSHDAKLGPLEFTLKEKESIHIPVWVGLVAIGAGTVLVWRRKG